MHGLEANIVYCNVYGALYFPGGNTAQFGTLSFLAIINKKGAITQFLSLVTFTRDFMQFHFTSDFILVHWLLYELSFTVDFINFFHLQFLSLN